MRRIMLTGKNGQLGWELQRSLAPLGKVVALGRADLDLTEPGSIRRTVRAIRPDVIVNAAAYTAVDKAEQEPDLAMAINGVAPGVLAEEARRVGAALVHYSTDYVFDGDKSLPYTEDDAPNPLNVYGRTKLVGERAVEAAGMPHLILRTSWIYGTRGKNFLLTILRLAEQRQQLRVVADQVGTPNWSQTIADETAQILEQCCSPGGTQAGFAESNSVYHLSGSAHTSWYGLTRAILAEAFMRSGRSAPEVIPIGSAERPTPAMRPKNSVLANAKIIDGFGLTLPQWDVDVRRCVREVSRMRPLVGMTVHSA